MCQACSLLLSQIKPETPWDQMTPLQQISLSQRILDDAAAVVASNYAQLVQEAPRRAYDPHFAATKKDR